MDKLEKLNLDGNGMTKLNNIVVEKNGKRYLSIWISQLVLKCGNCYRGVISPYFEKKMECKVCGARIVHGKEAEKS